MGGTVDHPPLHIERCFCHFRRHRSHLTSHGMATTAQDSSVPLKGASEKKEDVYEEDRIIYATPSPFRPSSAL